MARHPSNAPEPPDEFEDSSSSGLPEPGSALSSDLAELFSPALRIPSRIDLKIRAQARTRASAAGRRRWRIFVSAVSAAAVLAIVFFINRFGGPSTPHTSETPSYDIAQANPSDINGDGVVDVLDALLLAQKIEAHTASNPHFDINHDGVIDDRDARAISRQVVDLTGGGR